MANTGEDPDAMLVKMEKKSKKSKSKTNDLEHNGDLEKKDKKRKRDSSEKAQMKEIEHGQDDEPAVEKDCYPKQKKEKKKKKHKQYHLENEESAEKVKKKKESREDNSDSVVENSDLQKRDKKRRKRDTSEKTQMKENEDEPAVEKDCNPNQKKEKKKKNKHHSQEDLLEKNLDTEMTEESADKVKKKKNKNLDTEMTVESADKLKKKKKSREIDSKSRKKKETKKVSFSDQVEVFPPSEKETKNTDENNLVRGKRFTPEEDEIVKEAVLTYIEVHNLGEDGLNKVLHCTSHKGMKLCWKEIATCIPYRPLTAVYSRAHILFERAEERVWTKEEKKFLKESQKKHGNKWKIVAEELGKHRKHVKDAWRRMRLENLKKGRWTQEEYQNLYDLVNLDLQMKMTQEKKSKHGMLRDNIPWGGISEKLSTRTDGSCCSKWYQQLSSSMVAENIWKDADDYWLIGALYELDAACREDVDWDSLLEHRDGEVCRKRWDQMVLCIGDRKVKSFQEQVDILAKRYRPDMAETRQDWDDKPVVP